MILGTVGICLLGVVGSCNLVDGLLVSPTEIRRVPCPDTDVDAVLITKDPGGTGSTAYHVQVTTRRWLLPETSTLFIADHIANERDVQIAWSGVNLRVTYPKGTRVFRQEAAANMFRRQIRVIYTEVDALSSSRI